MKYLEIPGNSGLFTGDGKDEYVFYKCQNIEGFHRALRAIIGNLRKSFESRLTVGMKVSLEYSIEIHIACLGYFPSLVGSETRYYFS